MGFSRVVEVTLNLPGSDVALQSAATQLLVSQLEPGHRRIGFDGRGFVDLCSRLVLAKVPPNAATPLLMTSLPNLLCQIPTSTGDDVMRSMWALCRAELGLSRSSHSATAFLIGLKGILIAVNREGNSKRTMSPALVKALQRFLVTGIFS